MSVWVVNTSPIVFLGHLGQLELLQHEGREVYIPRAVVEEVAQKPDTAAQALQTACVTWMRVRDIADQRMVNLVQATLHKGEAEAIVLAIELQADRLVVDDQDARRFADRCGLKVERLLHFRRRSSVYWHSDFGSILDLSLPCCFP
jgi:predicted nucleic acid-binding protein